MVVLRDEKIGNNNCQRYVKAGVRNNKKKTTVRLTRGLAQNEEQPLGVSFRCLIKQPSPTHSQPQEKQNCIQDGQKWDSRKWPNANLQSGTVYLGPSNQSIPSTRRTSHGHGWPLFVQSHHLNFMEQFRALTSLHTDGVITIVAERVNKQSESEEQLWKWLKHRSKTTQHCRRDCMMAGSTCSRGNGPTPGSKPA